MEAREILIANTRTQTRSKIMTAATTLGELKEALDAEGINYTGLTFNVAVPKMQLLDDAAPLPTNVEWKGAITNNLVILLTNATKKIESGCERTRRDAYDAIKDGGDEVMEMIKERFGMNYTNVSTSDLWNFLDEYYKDEEEGEDVTCDNAVAVYLNDLINALVGNGTFGYDEVSFLTKNMAEHVAALKGDVNETYKVGNIYISDEDIDKMIQEA